jgi:hypothetical protein
MLYLATLRIFAGTLNKIPWLAIEEHIFSALDFRERESH